MENGKVRIEDPFWLHYRGLVWSGDIQSSFPSMRRQIATCVSGALNEIWSYGEDVEKILERYIRIRENMRLYVRDLMRQAHEKGTPVMRPLFYDFPEDAAVWEIEDEYMFGGDVLVAPVTENRQRSRRVCLPLGKKWENA